MTEEQRERLCERLAESWLDSCDLKDLERFFYDAQLEALQASSEEELLTYARDLELDAELTVN